MGLFPRKKVRFNSVSNLSNHIWHYEGTKTYEDCEPETDFHRGSFKTRDRFAHYIAAGGLQYEERLKRQEREPVKYRMLVIRWLAVIGVLWVLFYFIQL